MFNYIIAAGGVGGVQLDSILIENSALGCDTSQGEAKVSWVINGPTLGVIIAVEYNFDGTSNYILLDSGIPASAGYQFENVSFEPGFVDLDSTWFKIRAYKGGNEILGSPAYASGPYACL